MVSSDDYQEFEDLPNTSLLRPQEEFDEDELGEDVLDSGFSPTESPLAVTEWGLTAREGASHEDLTHRLMREVPEVSVSDDGDGLGDTVGTDGELIDEQVGDERAGRLLSWVPDADASGDADDYWARDVGIDGGGASAEEAAVHIVHDKSEDSYNG